MNKIPSVNDEQKQAIEERNCSILVSAPAGSGKTKILVSRILSLLKDDYYHIDELLVLTFTKAAALEMKQRLQLGLGKTLQEPLTDKQKNHLLLQKEKIETAQITNFHSFCGVLLKQFGQVINIDRNYEIIENTQMIQNIVLDQCIDRWVKDDIFLEFFYKNFKSSNMKDFKELLLKFYTFSLSIVDFDSYIKNLEESVYLPIMNEQSLVDTSLYDIISSIVEKEISRMGTNIEILTQFCRDNQLEAYFTNFEDTEEARANNKPAALKKPPVVCLKNYHIELQTKFKQDGLKGFTNGELPILEKSSTISWKEFSAELQGKHNGLKKKITDFKSTLEYLTFIDKTHASYLMNLSYASIQMFIELNNEFKQAYQSYKAEYNLLDFNDLEHSALQLLEPQHGVVQQLHQQFKELMVDEYQDTNEIQESLISRIANYSEPSIPCFMVGDMKQSIYRFRQADPEIFKAKYDTYILDNSQAKRIDLLFNYRSNKIVLDSINYIFNQLMDTRIGGLEYVKDASAKLNYDYLRKENAKDYDDLDRVTKLANDRLDKEARFTTEILLSNKDNSLPKEPAEYEAMMVATRIKQFIENDTLDDFNKNPRKIEFNDIVVLMQATAEFVTFKKVFDRCGIESNIVLSKGFFEQPEIISLVHVLYALDCKYDDIALTSFITNYFVCSNLDEQYMIDLKQEEGKSIYEKLTNSSNPKSISFLAYYHDLKEYSTTHTVYDVICRFLQDSQYTNFTSGLYNGSQRVANIELFTEMMLNYQSSSLYQVTCELRDKISLEFDQSPSVVLSTKKNAVTFMTIHKSKGLEFPIVFLSQTHKNFNFKDTSKQAIFDKNYGFTVNPTDTVDVDDFENVPVKYESYYKKLLSRIITDEIKNEQMRLFYVALTRASQKIVCTGMLNNLDQFVAWQENAISHTNSEIEKTTNSPVLLFDKARDCKTYLDWLGQSVVRHPDFITKCKNRDFDVDNEELLESLKQNSLTLAIYNKPTYQDQNTMHSKFKVVYTPCDTIKDTFISSDTSTHPSFFYEESYNYEYPVCETVKSMAVTRKIEDGNRVFMEYDHSGPTVTNAGDIGTFIHRIFELVPYSKDISYQTEINKLKQSIGFTEEEIQLLDRYQDHFEAFFASEFYQEILASKKILKEKNFSFIDDEGQIINGIFDAICMYDHRILIIDYKTDRLANTTSDELLIEAHKPQLEYYRTIMQKIFPTYQIDCAVYYVHIDRVVKF